MVTRKRNSVSKQKRRKIKIKTQRGGMFYKCLDHNGNMVRKWTPCKFSRLFAYEKKHKNTSDFESKSHDIAKTRKKVTSPVRGIQAQRFDTFIQGPHVQKDTHDFLEFLQSTPCCDNYEETVIKQYFNPTISEKNLSILRYIVKQNFLTHIAEGIPKVVEKQDILQKLLVKLEYMRKHFEKHIKNKDSQYKIFLKSIEDFQCSEEGCRDFGIYLIDKIHENAFNLDLLQYMQFSHKFSDERKNFIIEHIMKGNHKFYKNYTKPQHVPELPDISSYTFPKVPDISSYTFPKLPYIPERQSNDSLSVSELDERLKKLKSN